MTTQTIEVEGLLKGYMAIKAVLINKEDKISPVCATLYLEKIQPRRIVEIEEHALNEAGWAIVSKYVEIVGEVMGGKLFNKLKPLLRIGITEYLSLSEVRETDIPLTNDEPKLSLSVDECKEAMRKLETFNVTDLSVKICRFLKESS